VAYDLGDVISLAVSITDSAGVAANATAVTLTVTLPDGTTETPTVSNLTTGSYTCDYTPATAGRYSVRWVATGLNASAYSDVFNARAASSSLLSLAEAKAAIGKTTTASDEELRDYLEATTSLIEQRCGAVVQRTVTERVGGYGSLVLRTTPVVSVTSLTGIYDNTPAVAASAVTVDPVSGIVTKLDGSGFSGWTYTIEYVAGRTGAVDESIQQAARVILQHLWRTQRGAAPKFGGDDGIDTFGIGYALPNRALELLQPFLLAPGIA
jgi:hypothetical protein